MTQFPDTVQTEITEKIMMEKFSQFSSKPIIELTTTEYNSIYSFIWSTLNDYEISIKNLN